MSKYKSNTEYSNMICPAGSWKCLISGYKILYSTLHVNLQETWSTWIFFGMPPPPAIWVAIISDSGVVIYSNQSYLLWTEYILNKERKRALTFLKWPASRKAKLRLQNFIYYQILSRLLISLYYFPPNTTNLLIRRTLPHPGPSPPLWSSKTGSPLLHRPFLALLNNGVPLRPPNNPLLLKTCCWGTPPYSQLRILTYPRSEELIS